MTALIVLALAALWTFCRCNRTASAMLYHRREHDDD